MGNRWSVALDGTIHEIKFVNQSNSPYRVLMINGNRKQVFSQYAFALPNIDYAFQIGNHSLRLVSAGAYCDLSVDGIFQGSGRTYQKRIPCLAIVFQMIYVLLFSAIIFVPVILYHHVSMWFIMAIPPTFFAIIATYHIGCAQFLPLRKRIVKPILFTVLMILQLLVIVVAG